MLKWAGRAAQAAIMILGLNLMAAAPARAADPDSTNGWNYGYDSLLRDLGEWRKSPHVRIDSVGATVKGRALWMVSITAVGDSVGRSGDLTPRKHRVFMHARTHPAEVQAQRVANEAIRFLLADNPQAEALRRDFIFNIIPMYNPDGVELGKPRQNAHDSDLERNWNYATMEPEPIALKKTFQSFMAGPIPIEVALNLHSDQFNCTRFFVFHFPAGTSQAYSDLEKSFIAGVQARFPGGIKDYTFNQTWPVQPGLQYPEGFWWSNYHENVMALTYEDTNCPNAGRFDSTATALVLGSVDYIKARMTAPVLARAKTETRVLLVPEGVRIAAGPEGGRWELVDSRGRRMAEGATGAQGALLAWNGLPNAPMRILSVAWPGGVRSRVVLPASAR